MSLRRNKNYGTSVGSADIPKKIKRTKRVVDIILNSTHPKYVGPSSIGTIFFSDEDSQEATAEIYSLPTAKPINRSNFMVPLIGEIVEVIQSISNNYYNGLGGKRTNKEYYYYPPLNIYNNTSNNSLPIPLNNPSTPPTIVTGNTLNTSNFSYTTEFNDINLTSLNKKLDNYLINLGYPSGRKNPKAPQYKLSRLPNGVYRFTLNLNSIRLGDYFSENPNQQPLIPSEGDQIYEGRSGQRIRFTSTGPNGTNYISDGATQVEDGNTTIGDPAILLSLGENITENINLDQGSLYILSNHKVPIDVSCKNIDSLNAEYIPLEDPLTQIAAPAPVILPSEPVTTFPEVNYNNSEVVIDNTLIPLLPQSQEETLFFAAGDDPLFENLGNIQNESNL